MREAKGAVVGPVYQTSTYDFSNDNRRTWGEELPPGSYLCMRQGTLASRRRISGRP